MRGANPVQKWCTRQMHQENQPTQQKRDFAFLPFLRMPWRRVFCTTAERRQSNR